MRVLSLLDALGSTLRKLALDHVERDIVDTPIREHAKWWDETDEATITRHREGFFLRVKHDRMVGWLRQNEPGDRVVSDGAPQERSSDGDSEGWTRRKEHALETQLGPNIVSGVVDDEIQKSSWTKGMFRLHQNGPKRPVETVTLAELILEISYLQHIPVTHQYL